MSVVRADRTGPTGFDPSEWNRAAKRVMPPSTPSSKTTSAWLRPIWGRASGALSIFTTRTGRLARPMSIGSPVSRAAAVVGAAGTATGVVAFVAGGAVTAEGAFGFGFGFVVTVVDVAARVVLVVAFGFGRVVVVVDDVVVVGAGLIVSTLRRSVPQALPTTRRSEANRGRIRVMGAIDRSGVPPETGGYAPSLTRRLDRRDPVAEPSHNVHQAPRRTQRALRHAGPPGSVGGHRRPGRDHPDRRPHEDLRPGQHPGRHRRGPSRAVGPGGRDLRAPRPQRRRQDHHRRDAHDEGRAHLGAG